MEGEGGGGGGRKERDLGRPPGACILYQCVPNSQMVLQTAFPSHPLGLLCSGVVQPFAHKKMRKLHF